MTCQPLPAGTLLPYRTPAAVRHRAGLGDAVHRQRFADRAEVARRLDRMRPGTGNRERDDVDHGSGLTRAAVRHGGVLLAAASASRSVQAPSTMLVSALEVTTRVAACKGQDSENASRNAAGLVMGRA